MTPKTQATREALILSVLNAAEGFPISTRVIAECVHPSGNGHQWALATLHQLAGRGQIERWHPTGTRTYYWRR